MRVRIVVGVVFLCLLLLLAIGFFNGESLKAKREKAREVRAGMTKQQVVESLGVMYDGYDRGQYDEVDIEISKMNSPDSIAYVGCWRLAYSSDIFFVGFDIEENVISVHLD